MIRMSDVIPAAYEYADVLPDFSFVHGGRRVLIYAFTPQWIAYMSLIAAVLVQRGCRVDFAWSRPFEHDNADQEVYSRQLLRDIAPTLAGIAHPRLRSIDLGGVPLAALDADVQREIMAQTIEDTVHQSREIRVDIVGDHRTLHRRRLHLNQVCAGALLTLLQENDYDAMLTPNGKVFEFGMAYRLARMAGLPVCTIESFWGGTDEQLAVSWEQPAIIWDKTIVADAWAAAAPHRASTEVHRNVEILQARFNKPSDSISDQFCEGGRAAELWERLRLARDKPIVLVLPSLGHEKHFRLEHYVFADHVEWFEETLKLLAARDDCQVVIRSHPFPYDSRKDPLNHGASREIPERLVGRLFERLPEHFRFIGAQEEVNTYDLMEIGDCVLTHHSVTALEMALRGKAAVVCSSIHYSGKGFTHDPRSREEYEAAADRIVRDPVRARLTPRQVELAQCYLDVFYFRWPRPFPWNIFRRNFLYERWPLNRVYTLAFILSPFLDSIDFLVDDRPISDGVRQREFNTYLAAAQRLFEAKEYSAVETLLGDTADTDLAGLVDRRPALASHVLRYWPWIVAATRAMAGDTAADAHLRLLDGAAVAAGPGDLGSLIAAVRREILQDAA